MAWELITLKVAGEVADGVGRNPSVWLDSSLCTPLSSPTTLLEGSPWYYSAWMDGSHSVSPILEMVFEEEPVSVPALPLLRPRRDWRTGGPVGGLRGAIVRVVHCLGA